MNRPAEQPWSPDRVEAGWSAIERELDLVARRRRRASRLALVAALLLPCVWLGLLSAPAATTPSAPPQAAEAAAFHLVEGVELVMSSESRLGLCDAPRPCIALERGALTLRVHEHATTAPSLQAAGYAFELESDDGALELSTDGAHFELLVTAGRVRVSGPEQLSRVTAGQTLSDEAIELQATLLRAPEPAPTPPVAVEARPHDAPPRAPPPTSSASARPQALRAKQPPRPPQPSAASLWSAVQTARRDRDPELAVTLIGELLRVAPGDRRATLARFERARLLMDSLGRPRAALEDLQRVIDHGRGVHHEAAIARIVRAHAKLGQREACRRWTARYRDAYPEGIHSDAVASACP